MIKNIKIINHIDESIILELARPELTGLLIKSIDGLGPPQVNINMTEYVTNDGSIFNSAHVTSRQLIITLKPLGTTEVEKERLKVYRFFPLKRKILIIVETDSRKCKTEAYVESVEPDIFSDDETITITLNCPDSYFKSLTPYNVLFRSVDSLFSFPFSNESIKQPLIELGDFNENNIKEIYYNGDADTGIKINAKIYGEVKGLTIYNGIDRNKSIRINDEIFKTITGSYLKNNDELIISTIKGERGIWLIRDDIRYNVINAFERPIGWMSINYGENYFAYYVSVGEKLIDFSIEYDILYMGV